MQARTMPSTAQNSYLQAPPHLRPLDATAQQTLRPLDPSQQMRPLDTTAAQQMRQMDQTAAAAAAAAQQYRAHDSAMAQQLQRQLQPQILQNQAALQMRNQQMTVQEYHNLLRLTQPASLQQRRQTISGTSMNQQMASTVQRLQRPAVTMAPPQSSLQFSHQMAPPLSTIAPPLSLAAPIPLPQPNLLAQHLMSNAMRAQAPSLAAPPMSVAASVSQPQQMTSSLSAPPTTSATVSTGGMDDAEFLAFLENVRQIEAHLTRTLAESIQRSTNAQQQSQ
ncbi:hypothetical protein OESDEN_08560 [Oesophagostomum dentatum]|uniref:Uncharacterized protein n=1 Tax=Oesophagostomum dentatum TaxID=61180 RepID=A0A0B1T2W6_OESDE|nr:hypothetical protein OESDEN_08560 [Oesophagostomum dentatum]